MRAHAPWGLTAQALAHRELVAGRHNLECGHELCEEWRVDLRYTDQREKSLSSSRSMLAPGALIISFMPSMRASFKFWRGRQGGGGQGGGGQGGGREGGRRQGSGGQG
eukprot:3846770-Pleurochrysis_carterae.AAC.2